MPVLRLKEMRDMPSDERMRRVSELRTELLRLNTMVRAGGTIENPARIGELRKTIARMLTVENEQKLGLAKAKETETEKKTKKTEKKAEKKVEKKTGKKAEKKEEKQKEKKKE